MSETKELPAIAESILTPEQIEKISGGECTTAEILTMTGQLKSAYDDLVDLTSYVMDRVLGP
jgi:hypothetical protein